MPQVPLASGPQVRPTVAPLPDGARVAAPDLVMGDFTQRQIAPVEQHDRSLPLKEGFHSAYNVVQPLHEDTGALTQAAMARNLGAAGDELGQITNAVSTQTNALLTDNAVNKAKEAALRLAYDKDTGFTSLKGYDALNRPEGKPLADEYAGKFDETAKAISKELKNDDQRRAFAQQALGIRSSLYGQATQHESQEFRTYNLSTQEGTIKTETANIGLNYKDPDAVKTATERIKGAVAEQGMALGKSHTWIEAAQYDAVSSAHAKALKNAMEDGNVVFADAYLKAHKAEIGPDDVLGIRGMITKEMDGRTAIAAAKDAMASVTPGFVATDLDRAKAIVKSLETGAGSGMKADGTMVEGPQTRYGTAKGPMQVLDGTNKDPGFGVKPARDDSAAERTRVGQDYFEAMVKRYNGDLAQAYAAYNWGPGHLDAALKEAQATGKSWLDLAPTQTQNYVHDGMAAYASGGGAPPTPTLADALAKLDADPRVNGSRTRLDWARTELTARYEATAKAKKQGDEDATANALRAVEANGGNYLTLPPSLRATIPPDKIDTVMNFADKVRGGNTVTNLAVYQRLTDDKALKGMSDSQFYALRPELSPDDFKHFSEQRAKLLDPQKATANGPGELNTPAIHMVVENRLQTLGINATPKAADAAGQARVGAINKYVREQILLAQAQHGKKFNDAETESYIDGLFAKSVPFRNTVLGIPTTHDRQRMLEMTPKDIPVDARSAITDAFKKRGINSPTDADVLSAYWRTKSLAGR